MADEPSNAKKAKKPKKEKADNFLTFSKGPLMKRVKGENKPVSAKEQKEIREKMKAGDLSGIPVPARSIRS